MAIAIVDAARLRKRNLALHRDLTERHDVLVARCEVERQVQNTARRLVYDEALGPFRTSFARLKNVDLAELAVIGRSDAASLSRVAPAAGWASASGLTGAVAGGLGSGAGIGATAYTATVAAVGTFAAASTGTPIAALSGAAATNATLAFLGGGSLATGGGGIALGTTVLNGVTALPAAVAGAAYMTWDGRRQLGVQREAALTLALTDAALADDEAVVGAVLTRCRRVRDLLAELCHAIEAYLPRLACLVAVNEDLDTYTDAQRAELASMVGLVTATVALMAAPLVDADGAVTDLSDGPLSDAEDLLRGDTKPDTDGDLES